MATRFTGGCMCGAVRYECATEPVISGNCHCRDCQRAGGGGFVSVLLTERSFDRPIEPSIRRGEGEWGEGAQHLAAPRKAGLK